MSGREAAKEAIKKRNSGGKQSSGGKILGKGGVGEMKFFTEDAPGLKVHPKTVLVVSLVYIGIVVLLHIWSKIGGAGTPKADAAA